ncbi:hemerythrin domain-containing protein [Streptomyces sp. PTM05]|uniref:Hemerythrin domain-containing protein n=1 Tax=Streptantibioticus parmotrematis TaxID=2873249 RepID=A0ABS7QVK6_9ACTN|nr:hemerythrin domain-containing protein [Streptantibioticus parmotrematis]MBY8887242.1 hemerythrin domain-containing protein [Streptantibioticus parmotrematis]
MGHGGDVITELTADHREVAGLFSRIETTPVGDKRRRELVDEVTIELVRHSVAEEQYLYPAVREHVEGGAQLADKEIRDHAEVEQLLKDLEGLGADQERFDDLVARLKLTVSAHVQDEEDRLFPALARACTAEELEELGDKVRRAKKTAPTRPHPSAPDTPPANKLLAPGAGLVDRARDLITGRGKH